MESPGQTGASPFRRNPFILNTLNIKPFSLNILREKSKAKVFTMNTLREIRGEGVPSPTRLKQGIDTPLSLVHRIAPGDNPTRKTDRVPGPRSRL